MSPTADIQARIDALRDGIATLLAKPRAEQPAAALALHDALPAVGGEAWNTAFGPDALYTAFTHTSVARALHAANRSALRSILRPGFRVLEIGGGNGALWEGLLESDARGEIVVVDPHPEGGAGVRTHAPRGVRVTHVQAPIERAELPEADAAVASLVLHHIAGADATERAAVGLSGPGKLEALRSVHAALTPRNGVLLVNEADIYCDLALPPGDPLLAERLVDSYVRRFARSILADLEAAPESPFAPRWCEIVRAWSLGQVAQAQVPYAERDVYELDVPSWVALFTRAGFAVEERGFTDVWMLFHRYRMRAAR